MIEPSGLGQAALQCFFAAMAERRVAEIMAQTKRLGKVFVEAQRPGHRPADLRHLERMSQPNAKMIAIGRDKHLRLVSQPAEGDRVNDPVAVTLEGVTRTARASIIFREGPAARSGRLRGEGLWKLHLEESFSILICDGVRVQLKPSTPSLASLLTNDWLSDFVSKGPITSRK